MARCPGKERVRCVIKKFGKCIRQIRGDDQRLSTMQQREGSGMRHAVGAVLYGCCLGVFAAGRFLKIKLNGQGGFIACCRTDFHEQGGIALPGSHGMGYGRRQRTEQ